MHTWKAWVLLLGVPLAAGPAFAQDAETLRKELDQMKKQFEQLKGEYQKAIDQMSERLNRIESKPQQATTPPAAPAIAQVPPASTQAVPSMPSVGDLLRPREPFSLYGASGKGQLMFDVGVVGDFIGDFSNKSTPAFQPLATFPGQAQRVFAREIEIGFWGAVDPYARAYVIIEAGEEFDPTNRTSEFGVELAEAAATITALPWGFQDKFGLMRNRFGLLNQLHDHDLPQPDRPAVLVNFFGQEGLTETGNELTWVPNLPFYLEGLFGIFNGDNEVAFGSASFRNPLFTGRFRTFLDFGAFGAFQLGGSVAAGTTSQNLSDTILDLEAKYKLTPEGWRHPLLTVAGEFLQAWRTNLVTQTSIDPQTGDLVETTVKQKTSPARLLRLRRGTALQAMAGRRPLRQLRVSAVCGPSVGGRALHCLPTLGLPALPPGVQVHAFQRAGLGQSGRTGRLAESQRGAAPSHVLTWCPSIAPVLGGRRSCRRLTALILAGALALGFEAGGAGAASKVKVVASLPDLKALTEAVGGDLVEVESLARGTQNPHDIEVRPSLMLKLRRTDLLVRNGVGGDPWVEPLLMGAQNARIFPGAPGYVDASVGVPILAPSGPVDRSRGDVHPEGNPHYTLDPANVPQITQNIVDGLKRVAPGSAAAFDEQRRAFLSRLESDLTRWRTLMEPVRGARVVTYHETFNYFLNRFGLKLIGVIEDRPGIPPSPTHLAGLIRQMKDQGLKVLVADPWSDRKTVDLVARDSGARALVLPSAVGGVKGVDTYTQMIDYNVDALAGALK